MQDSTKEAIVYGLNVLSQCVFWGVAAAAVCYVVIKALKPEMVP